MDKVKKLSNLDEQEAKGIKNQVNAEGAKFQNRYDEGSPLTPVEDYGLCNDCTEFRFTLLEFGNVIAKCDMWDKMRSSQRRVRECSYYQKRGQLSLWDMQTMAYIIDVCGKKIGF